MEQRESPAGTETERTGRRGARLARVARAVAWLTVILYAAGIGTTSLLERVTGLREENSLEDAGARSMLYTMSAPLRWRRNRPHT